MFLLKKASSDKKKQRRCASCLYNNPLIQEGNSPLYIDFVFSEGRVPYYPFMVKEIFDKV